MSLIHHRHPTTSIYFQKIFISCAKFALIDDEEKIVEICISSEIYNITPVFYKHKEKYRGLR